MNAAAALSQRLDRWLWHARVVKTRTLASTLVADGFVRVNGCRAEAPAQAVKPGDVLTIALPARVRVLKVTGILPRRADASAARHIYESVGAQG
ncbi:MAG TPA: S4 domain-containing protein [Xanthobacteraceae bacterium]|nr:S4 domain-containing protein [Xanthobacteraceae bacterium]